MKLSNNKKFVLNIFSTSLLVYACALIPPLIISVINRETLLEGVLLGVILISLMIGGPVRRRLLKYRPSGVKPRIYFFTTLFTWTVLIILTSIIFYVGYPSLNIADAIFEATASWTTTGAEAIEHIHMSPGLQMLRASCNWLGGVGIILFTITLLKEWHFTGNALARTEVPGPDFLKTTDTFKKTSMLILKLYASLTALMFLLLIIFGMEAFDALLTSLSGISTSGLQHINHGMLIELSLPIKIVITIFSFFGSLNCSLFILIFTKRFRSLFKNTEFSSYASRILFFTLLVSVINLRNSDIRSLAGDLGSNLMQIVSTISTSGYMISDCSNWSGISFVLLMLQMFIGACALSTGGGIKVGRVVIAYKSIKNSIFLTIHPSASKNVKYNYKSLSTEQIFDANMYIVMFMLTYLAGALALSIDINDIFSSFDFSLAMITNTGKTFGELSRGAYSTIDASSYSKIVMSVLMLAGRLEIYPLIMPFFKSFWIRDKNV